MMTNFCPGCKRVDSAVAPSNDSAASCSNGDSCSVSGMDDRWLTNNSCRHAVPDVDFDFRVETASELTKPVHDKRAFESNDRRHSCPQFT